MYMLSKILQFAVESSDLSQDEKFLMSLQADKLTK
jgi:hypothetical protein